MSTDVLFLVVHFWKTQFAATGTTERYYLNKLKDNTYI
jgi:hypothetical protein